MSGLKLKLFKPEENSTAALTLVLSPVKAGFPSPAENFGEVALDLNQLVSGKNKEATFYLLVEGNSMEPELHTDDILVVDRSLSHAPVNGKMVVALVNGEFTVKIYQETTKGVSLVPLNDEYKTIYLETELQEFEQASLWGVVTYILKKV